MSLFPLDLDRYRRWTVKQLYNLLKPYILEDCVVRKDFMTIFAPGNLVAPPSGGPCTFIGVQPSSNMFAQGMIQEARVAAEEGNIILEQAQASGEFVGR